MASLAQNVDENPRHVPWNDKNTEFEGGRQNMIGFSCMEDVYERTPYYPGCQRSSRGFAAQFFRPQREKTSGSQGNSLPSWQ